MNVFFSKIPIVIKQIYICVAIINEVTVTVHSLWFSSLNRMMM